MPVSRPARKAPSAWTTRSTWTHCASHRACVKVCEAAGAIDFSREPRGFTEQFDLVLDLRADAGVRAACAAAGLFPLPPGRPGRWRRRVLKLRELVGEFEKPKFFVYKQKLCAHSRNETVGCNACIEVCSAAGDQQREDRGSRSRSIPTCASAAAPAPRSAPRGALTYAYPRAGEQGRKFKTLLSTYRQRRRAGRRRCCCTARSAGRRWWRSSAARRS